MRIAKSADSWGPAQGDESAGQRRGSEWLVRWQQRQGCQGGGFWCVRDRLETSAEDRRLRSFDGPRMHPRMPLTLPTTLILRALNQANLTGPPAHRHRHKHRHRGSLWLLPACLRCRPAIAANNLGNLVLLSLAEGLWARRLVKEG